MDYSEQDWDLILNVAKDDVWNSLDNFLLNMNELEKHAPNKKEGKYQLKTKTKP